MVQSDLYGGLNEGKKLKIDRHNINKNPKK